MAGSEEGGSGESGEEAGSEEIGFLLYRLKKKKGRLRPPFFLFVSLRHRFSSPNQRGAI